MSLAEYNSKRKLEKTGEPSGGYASGTQLHFVIQKHAPTPLEWREVRRGLNPSQFTMDNIIDRIKRKGDLFKRVLDKTIQKENSKALTKLVS